MVISGAKRWLFSGTVSIVYAAMLLPMAVVVWLSFLDQIVITFPPKGYTWHWYVNVWDFSGNFSVSFEVALLAMVIGVTSGTAAAYTLARARFFGHTAIQGLLLGPLAIPGIVLGTGIFVFFLQVGHVTGLRIAGTLPGLIAAHVLLAIPWAVRLVMASIQGLDRSSEEAAANLGARPMVVFFRITLPMMRPGIVAAAIFAFIQSFENLDMTLLLTGPGYTTLPVAMLNYLEFRVDPTLAAVATCQIVLTGALVVAMDRFVDLSRAVS